LDTWRPSKATKLLIEVLKSGDKGKESLMNVALWIVQGLLAFAFVAAGGMKLFAYEKYKATSEKNGPSGLTRGLISFIGVAELAGAIGIVLPMAAGVAPLLSAGAAIGLSTIMLLAIGYHVRRRESPAAPGILFALSVFVGVGRFSQWR
jgi:hypothetical protein